MKTVKKLLALILAITLVATLSACHPKDEKALSLDDINITSSVYLLCLINAESEARSKVEANATENEITLTTDEDYYKQNIDGKTFEEWTKEIILNGNCNVAYLVIPQRWKDDVLIQKAIETAEVEASVLGSFDFLNAERVARAIKKNITSGTLEAKDFPLLLHIDEIICGRKEVNIPWESFTYTEG